MSVTGVRSHSGHKGVQNYWHETLLTISRHEVVTHWIVNNGMGDSFLNCATHRDSVVTTGEFILWIDDKDDRRSKDHDRDAGLYSPSWKFIRRILTKWREDRRAENKATCEHDESSKDTGKLTSPTSRLYINKAEGGFSMV